MPARWRAGAGRARSKRWSARLHRALARAKSAMAPNFDDAVAVQSALDAARL